MTPLIHLFTDAAVTAFADEQVSGSVLAYFSQNDSRGQDQAIAVKLSLELDLDAHVEYLIVSADNELLHIARSPADLDRRLILNSLMSVWRLHIANPEQSPPRASPPPRATAAADVHPTAPAAAEPLPVYDPPPTPGNTYLPEATIAKYRVDPTSPGSPDPTVTLSIALPHGQPRVIREFIRTQTLSDVLALLMEENLIPMTGNVVKVPVTGKLGWIDIDEHDTGIYDTLSKLKLWPRSLIHILDRHQHQGINARQEGPAPVEPEKHRFLSRLMGKGRKSKKPKPRTLETSTGRTATRPDDALGDTLLGDDTEEWNNGNGTSFR